MAGIKIDPEMLDIYMESLNKLMAGSETDGGNARLEVSGAGKTEDGLVRYNEEVNKLGDDLRELYGNVGEILGRIRDGTLEADDLMRQIYEKLPSSEAVVGKMD